MILRILSSDIRSGYPGWTLPPITFILYSVSFTKPEITKLKSVYFFSTSTSPQGTGRLPLSRPLRIWYAEDNPVPSFKKSMAIPYNHP